MGRGERVSKEEERLSGEGERMGERCGIRE